ncbi:MAG: right-handed parallel beta-helix repeat-containing protein [Armatimonadota bacterium]|nr:MAG: right-handed parallel beta-helix repeat-containing protein [Armatimonadota bacterium]
MRHLFVLAISGLACTVCQAAMRRVPDDFKTIGGAVQAAAAGDTILVAPGTYRERVVLPSAIHLIGEDAETCVITGEAAGDGAVVTVTGHSRMAGLTIRDGETGILLRAGASLDIENCHIAGNASDGVGFDNDFNTVLLMRRCLVTGNGDGVDLESTQGAILASRLVDNRDDGLDYDGDAGVLVHGCAFSDNGDDGIEIRLATRTHALILDSRFNGNGEDGVEIINSPVEGGDYNVLCVQNCTFSANRRFGVGFVAHGAEQHTGEMSRTAVYAAANVFSNAGEASVSANYASVFEAPNAYPRTVAGVVERGAARTSHELPVRVPLLVGIYNLRPTTDGTMGEDAEGVTVLGERVYVADDNAHLIYALDRRTGRVARAIPTSPFPGSTLTAPGPEGLDVVRVNGEDVLLLADDDGKRIYSLSLDDAAQGQVLRRWSTQAIGAVEGMEAIDDRLLLAAGRTKIYQVTAETLAPLGDPVIPRFEGFGDHIAGIGTDETQRRVFATFSAYVGNQNWRNHRSGFLEMDSELQELRGFWHLGPFSNDPRGIAVSDGLVYVADGRSDFTDRDTGEVNRAGMKVFVFLLEDDADALARALPLLPLRREAPK